MKKTYTGREWSENRWSRFQIGLIIALLFTIYAFNYESSRKPIYYASESFSETEIDQLIEVFVSTPPKSRSFEIAKSSEPVIIQQQLKEIFTPQLVSNDIEVPDFSLDRSSQYIKERAAQLPLPGDVELPIEEIISNKVLNFAERMPLFEECLEISSDYKVQLECSTKKLMQSIQKNLRYPAFARENGIEETVIVSFVIGLDGQIVDIKIEREVAYGFDLSVINAIEKVPNMLPGEQNEHKVKVKLFVPVKFKLAK